MSDSSSSTRLSRRVPERDVLRSKGIQPYAERDVQGKSTARRKAQIPTKTSESTAGRRVTDNGSNRHDVTQSQRGGDFGRHLSSFCFTSFGFCPM